MTLTAVLFAGGQSRRMGADKATLTLANGPLWARQLGVLRDLRTEALWVAARVQPGWHPGDARFVPDAPPSRGPLSGLAAALRNLSTTHLLALAVDMPAMGADHLRSLWSLARPGCGVLPLNGAWFEPLCAIYPREAVAGAVDALARDDLSLQRFVETLRRRNLVQTRLLTEAEKPLYANINTPAELQNLPASRG